MNVGLAILIGGIAGALDGGGIFFEPKEPYKIEILCAAILKGIFVSVMTALSLTKQSTWLQAAGFGLLYGFGFALVIFLAKGAFKSKDAPYVVPSGIVLGLLTGLAVWKFALV
jgi:Na+/H+ antiporter NhaA